jgi:hypothetical protein
MKSKLAAHFGRINTLFIIAILIIFISVGAAMLYDFSDNAAENNARFYSLETVKIVDSFLNREIALLRQAARSASVIEWFADENNVEKKYAAFKTKMEFTESLQSTFFYFAVSESLNEYVLRNGAGFEEFTPFNILDPLSVSDEWFFYAISSENEYSLNIDIDGFSKLRNLWINHQVIKNGNVVGVLCIALLVDDIFMELFEWYDNPNVIGYIIDRDGFIQIDSSIPYSDPENEEDIVLYVENIHHILYVNSTREFVLAINNGTIAGV